MRTCPSLLARPTASIFSFSTRSSRGFIPRCGLALVLALTPAGCQGPALPATYEVKGRVLLGNGKPLTKGRVTFVAADGLGPPASGDLGPEGEFTLSTRGPGDGAPPGRYKVRIEPAAAKGRTSRPGFPVKYIDEDSSGLAVTVRAEPNQLEPITLK